ncbi:MAG TPA: amidase family protein [Steroidobacteraceae bacterium]|nr:amidase family protein [Steroidobacteraceae bacterium]
MKWACVKWAIVLIANLTYVSTFASSFPVEELSIEQLHAAYKTGKVNAADVMQAHLDRIAAYDKQGPLLNSIITVNPSALSDAAALDVKFKMTGKFVGPLHGVPVIVKDNLDAVGMPMTSGFQGWKNYRPPTDATLVKKIRDAGGIILAKASLSEFARGGGDNINSVLGGFARNPYNLAFATGGSSGGTGASLAASFGIVGIGTDTGGSVRMPAAHNALVGLRPTVGLVSRSGLVPLNSVRDTAGPMARSVADMAVLLSVIAGADGKDAATARSAGHVVADYTKVLKKDGLKGVRLGVLRQVFSAAVADPRVIANFEKTLAELKAAGATIVDPFNVPELDSIPRPPQTQARFKDDLTKFIADHPGIPYPSVQAIADSRLVHPLHQQGFEQAAAAKPVAEDPETIEGAKNEQRYRDGFTQAMNAEKIDAVVFPTWAQLPAINGDRNTQIADEPKLAPNAAPTALGSSLTFVGSSLQWPALSVPNGYLGEGLPAGLQILGRAWDEAKIIQYAYAYEQATHYRHPPSSVPSFASSTTGKLVGTWQLVTITERDAQGQTQPATRGASSGQLVYSPNGRLSVQIMKLARLPVKENSFAAAAPDELKNAVDGVSSYYGTWEMMAAEECVIHVQAGNLNPGSIGQRAKRCFSFDAVGRLSLATPLQDRNGKQVSTIFTWEKIY